MRSRLYNCTPLLECKEIINKIKLPSLVDHDESRSVRVSEKEDRKERKEREGGAEEGDLDAE